MGLFPCNKIKLEFIDLQLLYFKMKLVSVDL
jgi:hypothetical protein